jgi:hypothetical protein
MSHFHQGANLLKTQMIVDLPLRFIGGAGEGAASNWEISLAISKFTASRQVRSCSGPYFMRFCRCLVPALLGESGSW